MYDVLEFEKINWKDVDVHASIGSEFKRSLSPFLKNINIPEDIKLQLISSGDTKKINEDGKAITTWGNVSAKGIATQPLGNLNIDLKVTGEKFELGKWMDLPWLGPIDLIADAKGTVSRNPDLEINGMINAIEVLGESIHEIAFQSSVNKENSAANVSIKDPRYKSEIESQFSFAGPVHVFADLRLDDFNAGRLLHTDSTLSITGTFKSNLQLDESSIKGHVNGDRVLLKNKSMQYALDTLAFTAMISPTASDIEYFTNYGNYELNPAISILY